VNYAAAIADHRKVVGGGLFQFGATSGTHVADFDQSYDTINGLTAQSGPSSYTAQSGDTLQSVAQAIWGDSNFWYLIADANGLDSTSTLTAGQTLIIPNRVANSQNTSSTYNVYDPNDAIGNISPTHPPKPVDNSCGAMGQIMMLVVAIVVAAVIPGIGAAIGAVLETAGIGATAAAVIGAGVAGAIGSAVTQGVAMATGMQRSFNWGSLGMAALSAGVGAGVGSSGAFSGLSEQIGDSGVAALQGITGNVISQGVGVATGMQKSFDWGGVAAAGVSAGVIHGVGDELQGVDMDLGSSNLNASARDALSGMAGLIANASARTLIDGTDFGDNLIKGLPDVIGQTVGGAIADEMSSQSQSGDLMAQQTKLAQQELQAYADAPIAAPPLNLAQLQANMPALPEIGEDGTVTYPGIANEIDEQPSPIGSALVKNSNAIPSIIVTPAMNTQDPAKFMDMFGPEVGLKVLELVHESPTMTNSLNDLYASSGLVAMKDAQGNYLAAPDAGATEHLTDTIALISIGPSSKTNVDDEAAAIVQTLLHELGHADYPASDKSSEAAFVTTSLDSEGAATVSNIIIRNEIMAAGGTDIGIAGNQNNTQYYKDQYKLYSDDKQTYDDTVQDIGGRYATGEQSSAAGHPYYQQFFEDQYAKYLQTITPPKHD
jgi:LysM domain